MAGIKRRLGSLLGPDGRVPQIEAGQATLLRPDESPAVDLVKTGPAKYRFDVEIPRASDEAMSLGDEHLDTVVTPGTYIQGGSADADESLGYPRGTAGLLVVSANASRNQVYQTYIPYRMSNDIQYQRTKYIDTWYPWKSTVDHEVLTEEIDQAKTDIAAEVSWTKGTAPDGTDWDEVKTPGIHIVRSTSRAETMFNLPEVFPGVMTVIGDPSSSSISFQEYRPSRAKYVWVRESPTDEPGTWGTWQKLRQPEDDDKPSFDYGLANKVLRDFFTREMGGSFKTGGIGAVAVRVDHGLKDFNEKFRPLLEERNIPYSLAISSRRWDHPENEGITPAMVNQWVEGGLCEIWNHGALAHNSVHGYDDIYDYWVTGREELEQQIPAAKVWGAVPPGTGDDEAFDGMGAARTPETIYGTTGGQLILGSHAVVTGLAPGGEEWVLDGVLRQGNGRLGFDSRDPDDVISQIDAAVSRKRGIQIFFHPTQIDRPDKNTTAQVTRIFDHIAEERDNGRLLSLSPYKMLLADSRD